MSMLYSPLTIRDRTFKNRIVMSPMCQYSSDDGFTNDWHLVHLGTRATGGVGLVFTEATAIAPAGRISPADLGIWKDEHIPGLIKVVNYIHQQGAMAGIQLAHAGRKASCATPANGSKQLEIREGGWITVAPSNIPFNQGDRPPEQLNQVSINKVVHDFREAAKRAFAAGFDVIEIHAAHGYLLHEFLSPLSNRRKDEYGGSFTNRTRLLTEIVEATRSVWPEGNPLFVRISSTDWTEGGWSAEDSVNLGKIIKGKGVDLIDCSSGGNINFAKIPVEPGYQVTFSEAVRKTGILTGAVGMITEARQADLIINEEKADLIFLGRELLRNPYFALNSARELGEDVAWPVQYIRAKQNLH